MNKNDFFSPTKIMNQNKTPTENVNSIFEKTQKNQNSQQFADTKKNNNIDKRDGSFCFF